jgi:diadenosine tetraphosphate (Ap4A) HIT family hydrolase
MTTFELHAQLARDAFVLGDLPLSRVLLMNDALYPWVVLVPRRPNVREIYELDDADQIALVRESSLVARTLAHAFHADKINVAALGNVVPQLHVHHVARFRNDPAWPAPVWGRVPPRAYEENELVETRHRIENALADHFVDDAEKGQDVGGSP